jgi:hypothetical protein
MEVWHTECCGGAKFPFCKGRWLDCFLMQVADMGRLENERFVLFVQRCSNGIGLFWTYWSMAGILYWNKL